MLKLSHEQIMSRQVVRAALPRVPLVVVLDNIRSLNNVGSIFRTADGLGIEKVWLCGITGYPPRADIAKTSLGAEESVPWEYGKQALKVVQDLKALGYRIVALEQAEKAVACEEYSPQGPLALIVGNEVEGVSDELMGLCDDVVEIPMNGVKNSLNVSVAFGIVASWLRQKLVVVP